MAKFTLSIETNDVSELAELGLRLAAGGPLERDEDKDEALSTGAESQPATAAPLPLKRRGRPAKDVSVLNLAAEPPAPEPVVEAAPAPAPAPVVEAPAPAAQPNEEITYDCLKGLLTDVLKSKSAKAAQDIIVATTGGRAASLQQLQPDDYAPLAVALRKALQ
ncbi:MAG: hypothetical protein INH13_25580 [Cupriavidus sp.]|nr:hypothetical protein [Cupriavidus sp.]